MSDPEILVGRYRLVRQLGRGSSCDVYEAEDLTLGATVALKRFREYSVDALMQIKAEFRTLAEIHVPGLIRLFDLVVADGTAFFTMELVDGVVVTEYARRASVEQTRAVLGRVASALAELHARRQLHRDIKPANILVAEDGRAWVLDFGLAGALGATAGTLAYTAPELFEGHGPTAASDWYGFGAVLYELFAGRVPASGRDVAEIVLRKKMRRFPAPRELNPEMPADLNDLTWGLLEPDPRRRSGHDAIAGALPMVPVNRAAAGADRVELIGRGGELARLDAGLANAIDGRPGVLLIEGESGAGKSSLVRSFLAGPRASGCFVMKSAARPQESVPLRAIDAAVDDLASLIARLPATDRAALAAELPRTLVQAFPALSLLGLAGDTGQGSGAEGTEIRHEAQLAFARVLRRLGESRPVVLWIDDLQWADLESTLVLESIVSNAGTARLFVVLSRRATALPWPDREAWLAAFERIALGPLDDDTSRALLNAHSARRPMTRDEIVRAMQQARGNAFLLEFLARHAASEGADMDSALRAVLDTLELDERVLFECVALAQHPVPLAYLGRVLANRARLRDHAARLSSEGLISVDERECVRPYHDALRERAEAAFEAATRRGRHASLASAFEASGAPIEWQIPHLEGSGQSDAAARASVVAGRNAAARYAFEIASAYFEKALGLGAFEPPARAELLEALSSNLAQAGNGRAAAVRYEEAAGVHRALSDARAALAMRHKGAIALLRSGEIEAGRAALKTALGGLGERLPRMAMLASIYEATRLALASRAPAGKPLAPRTEMQLDTLWTSATSLSMYEPFLANALALRFVRRALAAGEPRWRVRALALEAAFLAALGKSSRARADRTMAELREAAAAVDLPYERAWVAATEGSTAWLSGNIRACHEWTSRARTLFRGVPETGAYEFALLDSFRLPAMALLGHHDAVIRDAEDVLAIARARRDGFATLPCLHGHVTLSYLATGRLELAIARADEASAIARQARSPMPAYHQVWSRATIALFRREGEGAHAIVADSWGRLRRSGMLLLEAVAGDLRYLRARCALAAARGAGGRHRGRRLRDALAQARWLRASTLALGAPIADAIECQVAMLEGREEEARSLADPAISGLRYLGLMPASEALTRWLESKKPRAIDRIYSPSEKE